MHVKLSERERQVVELIHENLTYSEIAIKLEIGYETVRTYVNRLKDKTGKRSRGDLAKWFSRKYKA